MDDVRFKNDTFDDDDFKVSVDDFKVSDDDIKVSDDDFKDSDNDLQASDDDSNYYYDDMENLNTKDVKPKKKKKKGSHCCHNFCLSTFDESFRLQLKSALSKLTKSEKRIYLFGMISINEDKQSCPKLQRTSSKLFEYSVKYHGVKIYVCKYAFTVLNDTTDAAVRTLCTKMTAKQLIPTDNRGKFEKNHYCIPQETKELIEAHFYGVLRSPTIFKCVKWRITGGEPNIKQLWIDFVQRYGKLGHRLSRSSYAKYVQSFLTPETLSNFRSASFAYELAQKQKTKLRKKN